MEKAFAFHGSFIGRQYFPAVVQHYRRCFFGKIRRRQCIGCDRQLDSCFLSYFNAVHGDRDGRRDHDVAILWRKEPRRPFVYDWHSYYIDGHREYFYIDLHSFFDKEHIGHAQDAAGNS